MQNILDYIKTIPHDFVRVIISEDNVKIVYGGESKTWDVMTIEEFKNCAGL